MVFPRALMILMCIVLAGCSASDRRDALLPERQTDLSPLWERYQPKESPHTRSPVPVDRLGQNTVPLASGQVAKPGGDFTEHALGAAGKMQTKDTYVLSQNQPLGQRRQLEIDFRQASLFGVIETFFRQYVERPYALDPALNDRAVNWQVTGTYHTRDILQMFEAYLSLHGVVVDQESQMIVLRPGRGASEARRNGVRQRISAAPHLQTWKLKHVSASEAETLLQDVLGNEEYVQAFPSANIVAVAGTKSDILKADSFLHGIDIQALQGKYILTYSPRYLSPEAVATLIQNLPAKTGLKGGPQGAAVEAEAVAGSNKVVILVNSPAMKQTVKNMLYDLDGPENEEAKFVYHYPLRHQNAKEMQETLVELLPGMNIAPAAEVSVIAHASTNALLVSASADQYFQIKRVIDRLDFDIPSAMIDATIVEVQLSDRLAYGVEWFLSGSGFGAAADANITLENSNVTDNAVELGIVSLSSNTFATLDFLASQTDFNILSRPRVMVKNDATATIKSTDQIRLIKGQLISNVDENGDSLPQVEFEEREFGVTLQVTPRIATDGTLSMALMVEDSRRGSNDFTTGDAQPTFNTRELTTELVMKDRQTIMIGGLIQSRRNTEQEKVPVLGDLPLVGGAFANDYVEDDKTELVIFLTPHIVDSPSAARAVTEALSGLKLPEIEL